MRLKHLFSVSLILISLVGLSQSTLPFSDLTKNTSGKYIVKSTLQVYSGKTYEKYDNNRVGMTGELKDGKFVGLWTWWYEDGAKKRQTNYKDGVKDGYSYWWYKNGVKRLEIRFVDNRNVEQRRWNKKGKLIPNPKM